MGAAYAALISLSHILHQILHPPPTHHFLIPTQLIEHLQEHVSSFITFLEIHSTRGSREIEALEKRIVAAAHKAEDIIESFVVTQIQAKYKIHPERKTSSPSILPNIQREIREILPIQKLVLKKKVIDGVINEFISIWGERNDIRNGNGVEDATLENSKCRDENPKNIMVGFDEHLNEIRAALATHEPRRQIIPVVGMGGIGKTTLAINVYKDGYIVEYFDVSAWVRISHEYVDRDIFAALLQQINRNIETNGLSADEIGHLLHKELFRRRYFIVLDDMWAIKDWEMINMYLPDDGNGSRILVTTRLLNLALDIHSCNPYQVGFLNDDYSWALILHHVFGKEKCPNELEKIGKSIARKCGGLPLALVAIAEYLAESDKTMDIWERVEENVTSTANIEQCMKVLRLSYSQLPIFLKSCFLYLAVFPKNVEIRMSRLIKLWVAEGFIKPASGKTLEEVAEGYLEDLSKRNLIMVSKRGFTGKVKTCIIHDLVRYLCAIEVVKNKFLCIGKLDNPNISPHMKSERRLSIHVGTAKEKVCKVLQSATLNRSFLSHSTWDSRKCVARSFNLLRVLDAGDFYPMEEILQLFNSRYISCCGIPWELQIVSSMISLLWNLQTLVVPGSISLPSEIWKMPQLRHLKMPGITLPDPPTSQGESHSIVVLEHLQTLSTVKDFIFREEVLKRIPNVKKLGIDCDTSTTTEIGYFSLSNLVSLDKLESLILAFRGTWECMAFPNSLKKLSLSYCEIPWENMSVVGSLPNLEVLKLQTRAAKGQMWNPNADEFCRLKFLLIYQCEIETWDADDSHFPLLEHLHLVSMKMKEIPLNFAEIPTLQTIYLQNCSRSLFLSAKNISNEREMLEYEEIQVLSFPLEEM